MARHVVFLRAINVTGRFVSMATLTAHVRALGFDEVESFINSGNLIVDAGRRSTARVARTFDEGLGALLGFQAEAFVRTVPELRAIAAHAAQLRAAQPASGDVNVGFLAAPVDAARAQALAGLVSDDDELWLDGRELYWRTRERQSASKVSNAAIERRLQCRTTLRRVSMLQALVQRLGG